MNNNLTSGTTADIIISANSNKKKVRHINNEFFYRLLDLQQEVLLVDIRLNNFIHPKEMQFKLKFLLRHKR